MLIQPSPNGPYRVIGGAGGKLNCLKLTGERSKAECTQRQEQTNCDHKAGLVVVKVKVVGTTGLRRLC